MRAKTQSLQDLGLPWLPAGRWCISALAPGAVAALSARGRIDGLWPRGGCRVQSGRVAVVNVVVSGTLRGLS